MDEVETWTTDRQTLLAEKDEIARERNSLRADLNKFYERSANPSNACVSAALPGG